jgi:hypothetical protein
MQPLDGLIGFMHVALSLCMQKRILFWPLGLLHGLQYALHSYPPPVTWRGSLSLAVSAQQGLACVLAGWWTLLPVQELEPWGSTCGMSTGGRRSWSSWGHRAATRQAPIPRGPGWWSSVTTMGKQCPAGCGLCMCHALLCMNVIGLFGMALMVTMDRCRSAHALPGPSIHACMLKASIHPGGLKC